SPVHLAGGPLRHQAPRHPHRRCLGGKVMFRRFPRQPAPPPALVSPRDPLRDLAMAWRGTAADLNVASLRLGTHPVRRSLNYAEASVWMEAARQLEQTLKEEEGM